MAKQALALIYRPKTWDDLVEQDAIKQTIQYQLDSGEISHCYLFTGPAGCGKAQPLDSLVLTPQGFIRMGDVKPGQLVVDGQGHTTEVLEVYPQGERDIYRITFSDKTSIEVADNHINTVFRYNQNIKQREYFDLETPELIKLFNTSRFKLRVDLPVVDCWEDNNLPVDPYLLGCLIGDGSLHNNFSFSNSESDIVEKVNHLLDVWGLELRNPDYNYPGDYTIGVKGRNKCKYVYTYKGVDYYGTKQILDVLYQEGYTDLHGDQFVTWFTEGFPKVCKCPEELRTSITCRINPDYVVWTEENTLRKTLRDLGVLCKSVDKFIPKQYLYTTMENRIKLLQGLFDTDGYLGNGSCTFNTSSERLAEDFEFLVRSLGIQATHSVSNKTGYHKKSGEFVKCTNSHSIYLHVQNDLEFCSSQKHLSRRTPRQCEPMRKIVSIEPIGRKECQCIYVAADCHTYLTDNFTVTHNTTSARILANQINKFLGKPIEIDAASNSSVDDVRKIVQDAKFKSLDSEYKVYVIDECHTISSAGWQAFLKLLEEPPAKTIFILCTTDPQKLPATILSRVQRYDFQRISHDGIVKRLKYIMAEEADKFYEGVDPASVGDPPDYTFQEDALSYIAKLAEGGMRAAISYLDKCLSYNTEICMPNVVAALGSVDYTDMFELTNAMLRMDGKKTIEIVEKIHRSGSDLKQFMKQYGYFVLDLCKYGLLGTFEYLQVPNTYEDAFKDYLPEDYSFFNQLLGEVIRLNNNIKWDSNPKPMIQSTFLLLCQSN